MQHCSSCVEFQQRLLFWLVTDLRDDECDGVDGRISMYVEVLEADLLEKCLQERRW